MSGTRILIVDDDAEFRAFVRRVLTSERYAVAEAGTGEAALEALRRARHDIVLLDLKLPSMGGLETCRAIQAISDAAVIIVSAHALETDKIDSLDAGAVDFIAKPFGIGEFLARVRAALRRVPLAEDTREFLRAGDFAIDFAGRRVSIAGRDVRLTRREYDLLQCLVSNPNTPIAYRRLLHAVWGPEHSGNVAYLRTFINQLRKKIEPEPNRPQYIITYRHTGYLFKLPDLEH